MSLKAMAPIVEGGGEVEAIGALCRNIWLYSGGTNLEVAKPIRKPRSSLVKRGDETLSRAVELATRKLRQCSYPGFILILIDAEDDCHEGRQLGVELLTRALEARNDQDISCVVPNPMFETWFIACAGATSMRPKLGLRSNEHPPAAPETRRLGKQWIKNRVRYQPTVDQASFASTIDIDVCRSRSRSFDKLCRELEDRIDT